MMMEQDPSAKKSRKPYTLTKARESWTNDEHERFIKALQLYNRDWKKIETYVGTKTVVQIRSHAQKYFQKVLKSGGSDAIPPPRPKRRASDPPLASQASSAFPDTKSKRLASEVSTKATSNRADVDSDEGQQNSKPDFATSFRSNDAVEASAQLETSRSIVINQNLHHVYLFLASVFSQASVDHVNMLQQLSDRDRHLATRLLKVLNEELSTQQQQQQQQVQHVGGSYSSQQQQQVEQPMLDQQIVPVVPGADAAQTLAEAVQQSLTAAALQQSISAVAAVQQSISAAAAAAAAEAQQAAVEAPGAAAEAAATGGGQLQSGASTNGVPLAADALAAAGGTSGGQLPAADVTPVTDTGQAAAAATLQPAEQQQLLEQQLAATSTGQTAEAGPAEPAAAGVDIAHQRDAAAAALLPLPQQQPNSAAVTTLEPAAEAAVRLDLSADLQQAQLSPAVANLSAYGETGQAGLNAGSQAATLALSHPAASSPGQLHLQQQVTGFQRVQLAAERMQKDMQQQQQRAAQQQQVPGVSSVCPSGAGSSAWPSPGGFAPFAAHLANGMRSPAAAMTGPAAEAAAEAPEPAEGAAADPTAAAAAASVGADAV